MVYLSAKLVPVRVRQLRGFVAADPWTGTPARHWTLNLYRMISQDLATNLEWSLIKPKRKPRPDSGDPVPGGRALRWMEAIGFVADGGGKPRLLPRVLHRLWMGGEVPDIALPAMIARIEPALRRSDYDTSFAIRLVRILGWMLACLGVVALLGTVLFLPPGAHVPKGTTPQAFRAEPAAERSIMVPGGLAVASIMALPNGTGLQVAPGLVVPPGNRTLGWFQADDGRRLVCTTPARSFGPTFTRSGRWSAPRPCRSPNPCSPRPGRGYPCSIRGSCSCNSGIGPIRARRPGSRIHPRRCSSRLRSESPAS